MAVLAEGRPERCSNDWRGGRAAIFARCARSSGRPRDNAELRRGVFDRMRHLLRVVGFARVERHEWRLEEVLKPFGGVTQASLEARNYRTFEMSIKYVTSRAAAPQVRFRERAYASDARWVADARRLDSASAARPMRRVAACGSSMPSLSIAEVADRFPDFRVALVVAEDLRIGAARSAALAAEIAAIEDACRKRWDGTELSAIPGVAAWRAAYKGFGIKRTSYRSSVERLIKRVLAGGALPEVNALVDLYNAASLEQRTLPRLRRSRRDRRRSRLPLLAPRRQLHRHGRRGGRGPQRSAQGRRGRLRRRAPCAVPALELAPGRAQRRFGHRRAASR